MNHIELIATGDELLLGLTQEKNLSWLCRELTQAGGGVELGVMVRDDPNEISAVVRGAILRQADLVITCGGLGPTDDDQTLRVLANALNVPLEENAEALAIVEQRYRALYDAGTIDSPDLTPARRKMARLLAGATALPNTVGTAPGMIVNVANRTWICALPGPPRENRPMVTDELIPRLGDMIELGAYRERHYRADCNDESILAPLLRDIANDHPDVYVKSRAATFEAQHQFRILLTTRATSPAEAESRLDATTDALRTRLGRADIAVYDAESEAIDS